MLAHVCCAGIRDASNQKGTGHVYRQTLGAGHRGGLLHGVDGNRSAAGGYCVPMGQVWNASVAQDPLNHRTANNAGQTKKA